MRIFIILFLQLILVSCSYQFDIFLKQNSSEYKKRFETAKRIDELNEERQKKIIFQME